MSAMFKQCELTKSLDGGIARMISWIPDEIAVAGATVALKDSETGERSTGWFVACVGQTPLSGKILERQSRDYLRTRGASDV
jgi:hypothetical protein